MTETDQPAPHDRHLRHALHGAAGLIQAEIAEVSAEHVSEADVRRAVRHALQAQLGPGVKPEYPVPHTGGWHGRLGAFDVAVLDDGNLTSALEIKWCRNPDGMGEAVWDALKLLPFAAEPELVTGYLIYGARASLWAAPGHRPAELLSDGDHDTDQLLTTYASFWKRWRPAGPNSPRPTQLPERFRTHSIASIPILAPDREPWELRAVRIGHVEGTRQLQFDTAGLISHDQPAPGPVAPASRFIDTDDDIQIDPATLPENIALLKKLEKYMPNPDDRSE
jgi:hypothetical protein